MGRGFEHLSAMAEFDQLPGPLPHPEKRRVVTDAPCLGEVMGNDDEGIAATQAHDEIFDHAGGKGIQRTAGFVHQQDFELQGQCPSDAEPLLLSPRQA